MSTTRRIKQKLGRAGGILARWWGPLLVAAILTAMWLYAPPVKAEPDRLLVAQLTALSILFGFMLSAFASKQIKLQTKYAYLLWLAVALLAAGTIFSLLEWAYFDPWRELSAATLLVAVGFIAFFVLAWGWKAVKQEVRHG